MSGPGQPNPSSEDTAELARSTAEVLLDLLRATQASPLEPERVRRGAVHLENLVARWLERGEPLRIGLERHRLSFNDVAPLLEPAEFTVSARYCGQWKGGGVSGLVFLQPVAAKELTKVLLVPFNPKARGDLDWIRLQVNRYVPGMAVQLLPLRRSALPSFFEVDGRKLFGDLLYTLRFVAGHAPRTSEYAAGTARLRRLAEELTDFSAQAERLLPLVLIPPPIWPRACLTVQSAMMSVLFGQSLGLSRPLLAELGFCAFLADIAGLISEGSDAKNGYEMLDGLGFFARGARLDPLLLQALVVATEQVRPAAPMPPVTPAQRPHLFSRLVAICRRFVSQLHLGLAPRTALEESLRNPDNDLDTSLLRAFAHLLGPVPVGSIVRLTGREDHGLVCGTWRDRAGRRQPWVLDLGPGKKRFKALLTEPASGDEELPRVAAIELFGDVPVHTPEN